MSPNINTHIMPILTLKSKYIFGGRFSNHIKHEEINGINVNVDSKFSVNDNLLIQTLYSSDNIIQKNKKNIM